MSFFFFFLNIILRLDSSYYSYIKSSRRQIRVNTMPKGAATTTVNWRELGSTRDLKNVGKQLLWSNQLSCSIN